MATGTPEQFMLDIDAWTEKAKAAPMLVIRETIQDLNNEIVTTSPGPGNSTNKNPRPGEPTGFLRGSYFADVNTVPSGTGSIGRNSTAAVNAVAVLFQPGQTYVMGNTAKYARRLEYGFVGEDSLGRTYNQSGRYWVRGVLNRASVIAMEAATRVAGKL